MERIRTIIAHSGYSAQVTDGQPALAAVLICHGTSSAARLAPRNVSGCDGQGFRRRVEIRLGSKVSMDEGPPCMNRKITRLARAGKCGDFEPAVGRGLSKQGFQS